ncbi:uncharacterized protein EDB91DRAFT_1089061 [Suillus paluster]|uniref:uncharacterized protein n=1 Tax=Suillus paluster TaxID=48578 RepID=UPI001B863A23|nr:uncharacterized protein EDB91DRAFT_1089061 [Suillus paluster]KAG1719889.1 hypothetical protein EDB91DRAFT_1089061 [Suillus paluster]
MACICSGVRYMGGRCCQNIAKGHHINLAREHRIKGHHQHKGHHTTMGFNIAGGRSSNAPTKTSILERLDAAEKKIEKLENEGADKGKPPKKAATPNISNEHPILEDLSLGKAKRVEVLIAIKPLPNREPFEISENLIPLSMQNLFQSVSNCSECTGAFETSSSTSRPHGMIRRTLGKSMNMGKSYRILDLQPLKLDRVAVYHHDSSTVKRGRKDGFTDQVSGGTCPTRKSFPQCNNWDQKKLQTSKIL